MSDVPFKPLIPAEGMGVVHLFYTIDRLAWEVQSAEERLAALQRLEDIVAAAKAKLDVQVITIAMFTKADIGFMLIARDLQFLQDLEKKIARSLGAGVLLPVYTFFSLTEKSEYTTSEEEYRAELETREKISPGLPEFELKMATFRERIKHYTHDRLYPKLPIWEFFAFYPMLKRREPQQNWYAMDFNVRKEMMKGHATVGRKYSGKVMQLISGSTGLDDWEWGVSLLAHDPVEVKAIVYEMRFDPVTAHYGEFGSFYTGFPMDLAPAYVRLGLS